MSPRDMSHNAGLDYWSQAGLSLATLITGEFIMTVTILIPRGSRVFLQDDDDVWIRWFIERLTSITVAKEAPDAITILDSYPPFDFLFLDHDLELFTGTEGDGLQVAQTSCRAGLRRPEHIYSFHESSNDVRGSEKSNSSAVRAV